MSISTSEVLRELEASESDPDFNSRTTDLTARWISAGADVELVEPILRFMEAHPDLEYGMPGGLVHFAERFHTRGYERLLVDSVRRRPTFITTWMLNRLINGTGDAATRSEYVAAMRQASVHSLADAETRACAQRFLAHRPDERP